MVAEYQCQTTREPCSGKIANNSWKYEIRGDGNSSGNLTIKDLTSTDNGTYTCSVAVMGGIGKDHIELFVQSPGK